jgi:hypothetical protein
MPCGYSHYVIEYIQREEVADEVLQPTHSPFRRLFYRTGSVITARRYFYNYFHIHFPIAGADMTSHRSTIPTVSIAAAPP